jgi:hypothetical protein
VIQSGWAGLNVPGDDILTVGEVPHDWLFEGAAVVVHHCGAGTTAAGTRRVSRPGTNLNRSPRYTDQSIR